MLEWVQGRQAGRVAGGVAWVQGKACKERCWRVGMGTGQGMQWERSSQVEWVQGKAWKKDSGGEFWADNSKGR